MSKKQPRAQTPEEVRIQQGLRAAQMAQQIQAQSKAQMEAEQRQRDMMVRMFVSDTARSLYVEAVANQGQEFKDDEDFMKLADGSHHAALILAERLGMIEPITEKGKAEVAEATEAAAEETTTTVNRGGIIIEE